MTTIAQVIGGNLRVRREQLGWSQATLGQRMAATLDTPWTRQQVYVAEKGIRAFTAVDITALAAALGVTPAYLFGDGATTLIATPAFVESMAGDAEAALVEAARAAAGCAVLADEALAAFRRARAANQQAIL